MPSPPRYEHPARADSVGYSETETDKDLNAEAVARAGSLRNLKFAISGAFAMIVIAGAAVAGSRSDVQRAVRGAINATHMVSVAGDEEQIDEKEIEDSCCNLVWGSKEFAECDIWGDPHITKSFDKMAEKFSYHRPGAFKVAGTVDEQFEVQAFNCPAFNCPFCGTQNPEASMVGVAVKMGSKTIEVFEKEVYVNGALQTDPEDAREALKGLVVGGGIADSGLQISSEDCCYRAKVGVDAGLRMGPPHFEHRVYVNVASGTEDDDSVCKVGPTYNTVVDAQDLLFSPAVLGKMCQICDAPQCPGSPLPPDSGGNPPQQTAEEVCTRAHERSEHCKMFAPDVQTLMQFAGELCSKAVDVVPAWEDEAPPQPPDQVYYDDERRLEDGAAECSAQQKSSGCCNPLGSIADRWQFTAEGGGQWSSSDTGIRFDIANSVKCNGSATETQKGVATLKLETTQSVDLIISMTGTGEENYETFDMFVNGEQVVEVVASKEGGSSCEVNTCNMCSVSMPPKAVTIDAGAELKVVLDTQDPHYHKNAYFEIKFAAKKPECAGCTCAKAKVEQSTIQDCVFDFCAQDCDAQGVLGVFKHAAADFQDSHHIQMPSNNPPLVIPAPEDINTDVTPMPTAAPSSTKEAGSTEEGEAASTTSAVASIECAPYAFVADDKHCKEKQIVRFPGPKGKTLDECYQECAGRLDCAFFASWPNDHEKGKAVENDCRLYAGDCPIHVSLLPGYHNKLFMMQDCSTMSIGSSAGGSTIYTVGQYVVITDSEGTVSAVAIIELSDSDGTLKVQYGDGSTKSFDMKKFTTMVSFVYKIGQRLLISGDAGSSIAVTVLDIDESDSTITVEYEDGSTRSFEMDKFTAMVTSEEDGGAGISASKQTKPSKDAPSAAKKAIASTEDCTSLSNEGGRCGPKFGRCNKNMVPWAIYCDTSEGWCGDKDQQKNAQEGSEYDWLPKCAAKEDCAMPTAAAYDGPGKNCPKNHDPSSCLAGNKGHHSLQKAWEECGKVDGCGAIMVFTNGMYYLRRASDPDRPAGDGSHIYNYVCSKGDAAESSATSQAATYTVGQHLLIAGDGDSEGKYFVVTVTEYSEGGKTIKVQFSDGSHKTYELQLFTSLVFFVGEHLLIEGNVVVTIVEFSDGDSSLKVRYVDGSTKSFEMQKFSTMVKFVYATGWKETITDSGGTTSVVTIEDFSDSDGSLKVRCADGSRKSFDMVEFSTMVTFVYIVGQRLVITGDSGSTIAVTVVSVNDADNTIKVKYENGSFKSFDISKFSTMVVSSSRKPSKGPKGSHVDVEIQEAPETKDDTAEGPLQTEAAEGLCDATQISAGCCSPLGSIADRWQFSAEGGGKWSSSDTSIRFDIDDSVKCGGHAGATQKGTATLTLDTTESVDLVVSMQGSGEDEYETFELHVDGEQVVQVVASKEGGAACAVSTCNMCAVSMEPKEVTIKPGAKLEVRVDTQDPYFHKSAYFEITFAPKKGGCDGCGCARDSTTPAEPADAVTTVAPGPETTQVLSGRESVGTTTAAAKSGDDCTAAATPDGPGKNCPDNADTSTCINGNKGYGSLKEAWDECGKVDECGAVMLFKNGQYYLRRASDPDRPAGDGTQCYAYSCSGGKVSDSTTEKAKEKSVDTADTTTAAAKSTDASETTQAASETQAAETQAAETTQVSDSTTTKANEKSVDAADTTTAAAKSADAAETTQAASETQVGDSTTEKATEKSVDAADTTTAAAKSTDAAETTQAASETQAAETQAAETTQAPVVTIEAPGKCCDMLFSDPYFASCSFWGDPHWTTSFGQGKFDNMATGTFRNAVNKDGSFEQQQVQCSWNRKKTANTVVGVALKIAGVKIVVTNESVHVDDQRLPLENGAPPPSFSVDGVKITGHLHSGGLLVQTSDCCRRTKVFAKSKNKKGKPLKAFPGFFFNVDTTMPKDEPDARGICGKGVDYDTQVGSDDILFTKGAMQEICEHCSEEPWGKPAQCAPGFPKAHAAPSAAPAAPKKEDVTPEKMCASKVGIGDCRDDPLTQAQDVCKSITDKDDKNACVMDYCESDCDEDMAEAAADVSQLDPDAPDDDDDEEVSYEDDRL